MATRVLLFSKDPIVCGGLKALLEQSPTLELGGIACDITNAIVLANQSSYGVMLLEMHPDMTMNGIVELRRNLPSLPLVLWVQSMPVEIAHQVVQLGVQGILRKDLPVELLLRCLEKVAAGELWYERSLSDLLLRSREIALSPRERQLLRLISQGFSNKSIASTLMITEGTVKVYLSKLFKKVGVIDRFELALYGLKHMQYGSSNNTDHEGAYCPSSLIVQDRAKAV
jgi:DNA-binding NarL/FixJ family response regulator